MEITRYCSKCDTTKDINQFSRSKRIADGYAYQCKSCVKEWQFKNKEKLQAYQKVYQSVYRVENRSKLAEYDVEWRKNNPDKCKSYVKKSNAKNPERMKEYMKVYNQHKRVKND